MKELFYPGDIVQIKHNITNKPIMWVVGKQVSNDSKNTLLGIVCRWYTDNKILQEAVYNTKDLIKVQND